MNQSQIILIVILLFQSLQISQSCAADLFTNSLELSKFEVLENTQEITVKGKTGYYFTGNGSGLRLNKPVYLTPEYTITFDVTIAQDILRSERLFLFDICESLDSDAKCIEIYQLAMNACIRIRVFGQESSTYDILHGMFFETGEYQSFAISVYRDRVVIFFDKASYYGAQIGSRQILFESTEFQANYFYVGKHRNKEDSSFRGGIGSFNIHPFAFDADIYRCIRLQNFQCSQLVPKYHQMRNCAEDSVCLAGYFESQNQCLVCEAQCKQCENQAQWCTECRDQNQVVNQSTCVCMDNYYQINDGSCDLCTDLCLTCQNNSNECLTCLDNSHIDQQTCVCNDRYFEKNDSNSVNNNKCEKCSGLCISCEQFDTKCTKCPENTSTYNQQYNYCLCIDGYYEAPLLNEPSQSDCYQCKPACSKCVDTSENCTECSGRENSEGVDKLCVCKTGYYENQDDFLCHICKYADQQEVNVIDKRIFTYIIYRLDKKLVLIDDTCEDRNYVVKAWSYKTGKEVTLELVNPANEPYMNEEPDINQYQIKLKKEDIIDFDNPKFSNNQYQYTFIYEFAVFDAETEEVLDTQLNKYTTAVLNLNNKIENSVPVRRLGDNSIIVSQQPIIKQIDENDPQNTITIEYNNQKQLLVQGEEYKVIVKLDDIHAQQFQSFSQLSFIDDQDNQIEIEIQSQQSINQNTYELTIVIPQEKNIGIYKLLLDIDTVCDKVTELNPVNYIPCGQFIKMTLSDLEIINKDCLNIISISHRVEFIPDAENENLNLLKIDLGEFSDCFWDQYLFSVTKQQDLNLSYDNNSGYYQTELDYIQEGKIKSIDLINGEIIYVSTYNFSLKKLNEVPLLFAKQQQKPYYQLTKQIVQDIQTGNIIEIVDLEEDEVQNAQNEPIEIIQAITDSEESYFFDDQYIYELSIVGSYIEDTHSIELNYVQLLQENKKPVDLEHEVLDVEDQFKGKKIKVAVTIPDIFRDTKYVLRNFIYLRDRQPVAKDSQYSSKKQNVSLENYLAYLDKDFDYNLIKNDDDDDDAAADDDDDDYDDDNDGESNNNNGNDGENAFYLQFYKLILAVLVTIIYF